MKNQECYDKNGKFLGWFSRSMAVAVFIFRKNKSKWEVLTEIRGSGAADFQGKRCCVCGYCEFDDTLEETCTKEILQETNLVHHPERLIMVDINSSPKSNHQNITAHYVYVLKGDEKMEFEKRTGGEENEIDSIEWIDTGFLPSDFCFGHDVLIKEYVSRLQKNNIFNRLKGAFLGKRYIFY